MATDATTLLDETKCFVCLPPGMWQLLKLGLLKQILLASDPMADTSATALLAAAKCYECLPPGMWQLIELGLLQQIVDGGGAGGGGGVTCGAVDPVAAPTGSCAIYFNTAAHSLWAWNGAAWEALIV